MRKPLVFRTAALLGHPARLVLKELASEGAKHTFLEVYTITRGWDTDFVDETLSLAEAMGILAIDSVNELVTFNPEFLRQTDSWGQSSNVAVARWTIRQAVQ